MDLKKFEKKLENDIVVRQHYVPRCYLDAWTDVSKKIMCVDKSNKKTFTPKVEGIANERYFYKTNVLTLQQLDFLYKMWVDDVTEPLKDALMGWLRVFAEKDFFQTFCKEKGWNVASEWYLKNTEEKMFAHIEGFIPKWRNHLVTFDTSYWDDDDNKFMFILWILLQYIRTPQMQRNYLSKFEKTEFEDLGKNTQNVFRWLFATRVAHNILFSKDMKIIRLENKTNENFITSDQPVINVCASYKNIGELGYYDLELYYPITPNKAILITPKDCYSPWQEIDLTELQVKQYNIALEKMSERFIFKKI